MVLFNMTTENDDDIDDQERFLRKRETVEMTMPL